MQHKVVSRDEWLDVRKRHLAAEKTFTRARDALSRQRRELPWVKIEKTYNFDGPSGKARLPDLFGRRSQLIVYHFMFGPGWEQGCPSCSFLADHFDGATVHLAQRDVAFVAVSRAPYAQIDAFRKRMGWRFRWMSSYGSDFNYDFQVSFTPEQRAAEKVLYNYAPTDFPSEEAPGVSVFLKDADGGIYHTYSSYGRGLDMFVGTYQFLDIAPKGRDEDGLPWSMSWVRHHDRYEDNDGSDAAGAPDEKTDCCRA